MKEKLFELFYELSKKPYQKFFKKNSPWSIGINELLTYPDYSLGFHLAIFLTRHNFELQAKLESHDVYHVLTQTGVTVVDEISMQFYLLGNGKRSIYLFTVIIFGGFFFWRDYKKFKTAFLRGKQAFSFHQINFLKLLHFPLTDLKTTFSIH